VRKEVELGEEVELQALSYSICLQQWQWCWKLGVRVVRPKPVLESASVFPLTEEGDMVEEPLRVGVDTIQVWQAPFWEG
jgi:hypothetical protein